MGSCSGAAGAYRDLGSRLRSARQQVQDGRWRTMGVATCLTRRSKTGVRVENWLKIVVQLRQSVADGRGGQDTEGEGGGSRKS